MTAEPSQMLPCPLCNQHTDSMKQCRVIQTIVAFPIGAVFSSAVVRSCPRCMRGYLWKRCFINGLTTWIAGYIILVPYTLAMTVLTIPAGHSWPVLRGITPEMHMNRTWTHEATSLEKTLALIAVPFCAIPGLGIVVCWFILWRLRWCSGWVYKTAESASIVAYLVSFIGIYFLVGHLF